MNSKQRNTFAKIFDNPVRKNIKWTDVEKLIVSVGGSIKQADGSRIRIDLAEYSLNIHTQHPHKELKPYQVRAIRKLFVERGLIL